MNPSNSFTVANRLPGVQGRTGTLRTPHGDILTPAFIAVGTKATVKAVLPESISDLGAQAVVADAYHLYLPPGADSVRARAPGRWAGGVDAWKCESVGLAPPVECEVET